MDPQAALKSISEIISNSNENWLDATDICADLQQWIIDGGFKPDWNKHMAASSFYFLFVNAYHRENLVYDYMHRILK